MNYLRILYPTRPDPLIFHPTDPTDPLKDMIFVQPTR
jgi:hypothetical protein